MNNYVKIADSYFLFDFLEISSNDFIDTANNDGEHLRFGAERLIEYWKDRILKIDKGEKVFIPFDFSDQYIGGLQLEKVKLGFKTRFVYSDKIVGPETVKSNLDTLINDREIKFKNTDSNEWLISEEGILKGLDWSLNELRN